MPNPPSTATTPQAVIAAAQAAIREQRSIRIERERVADIVFRRWGEADGPVVVLFHGGAGSWLHWLTTIPALSAHYTVWAADLPGLGDSGLAHHRATPRDCADVMAEALTMLLGAISRPFHLVGFSWGAHVATLTAHRLASTGGPPLRDLTLIGCAALGLPHPDFEYARESSSMSDQERIAVHRANLELLMLNDHARIDDLALLIQARNVAQTRLNTRQFADSDTIARTLPLIDVPLKTIWGRHDAIGLPNVEARIAKLGEHHPELAARIIEDAGHWVMYEQPDAFNAALLELLALSPAA